jgi:hypothetical protein
MFSPRREGSFSGKKCVPKRSFDVSNCFSFIDSYRVVLSYYPFGFAERN